MFLSRLSLGNECKKIAATTTSRVPKLEAGQYETCIVFCLLAYLWFQRFVLRFITYVLVEDPYRHTMYVLAYDIQRNGLFVSAMLKARKSDII